MAKFIGRTEELFLLKNLLFKRSSSLIVMKGRRRIGKSRLLEEFGHQLKKTFTFSGLPPSDKTTNHSQKEEFATQLKRQIKTDAPIQLDDWSDLFWQLGNHTKQNPVLIILDEISWMGSLDPDFLGKLKIAWDLYFSKNDNLMRQLQN